MGSVKQYAAPRWLLKRAPALLRVEPVSRQGAWLLGVRISCTAAPQSPPLFHKRLCPDAHLLPARLPLAHLPGCLQGRQLHLLPWRVRVLAAPSQVPHAAVQGGAQLPPPRLLLCPLRAGPAPAHAHLKCRRLRCRRGACLWGLGAACRVCSSSSYHLQWVGSAVLNLQVAYGSRWRWCGQRAAWCWRLLSV